MNQPDKLANLLQNIPAGRLGRPHDVAGVVAFLASPTPSTSPGLHWWSMAACYGTTASNDRYPAVPAVQPRHQRHLAGRHAPPAERYQELFVAVQMQRVFPDSKTFVDCAPRRHPEAILEDYRARCGEPGFDLEAFVHEHFSLYEMPVKAFVANPDDSLAEHIDRLWPILTRHPQDHPEHSSLLPLPHVYVVPGGRFTELYYWDSYFTMLGLDESGHCDLLRAMADNFAYLIDTYGHVPNGNRTYYLGRSQPPVFALMTELFEETGVHRASDYLPQLHKEYAFWMEGAEVLRPGEAHRRCVSGRWNGAQPLLGRARNAARGVLREDVETARSSCRPRHEVYRDLRAGAESGWDFSSRWLDDAHRLATIRTTSILPVDLNALLYKLERQIAELSAVKNQHACAEAFARRAEARLAAIDQYLWNSRAGAYFDYDWQRGRQRDNLTAATLARCSCAWPVPSRPRRWRRRCGAPAGARRPGHHRNRWQRRAVGSAQWLGTAAVDWHSWAAALRPRCAGAGHRGALADHRQPPVRAREQAGGSTCCDPVPNTPAAASIRCKDGFGWTNGVTRKLMQEDPNHEANRCRAGQCPQIDRSGRERLFRQRRAPALAAVRQQNDPLRRSGYRALAGPSSWPSTSHPSSMPATGSMFITGALRAMFSRGMQMNSVEKAAP